MRFQQILNWHKRRTREIEDEKVSNLAISMPKDKHNDTSSNNIKSWTLLFNHSITRRNFMFLIIQFLFLIIFVPPWNCTSILFTCKIIWWNTLTHDLYKYPKNTKNRQQKWTFFFFLWIMFSQTLFVCVFFVFFFWKRVEKKANGTWPYFWATL